MSVQQLCDDGVAGMFSREISEWNFPGGELSVPELCFEVYLSIRTQHLGYVCLRLAHFAERCRELPSPHV